MFRLGDLFTHVHRDVELDTWQIRKTCFGIIPRNGYYEEPVFSHLEFPLPVKSLCRSAASQFGYQRGRSDLYLEIQEVDS